MIFSTQNMFSQDTVITNSYTSSHRIESNLPNSVFNLNVYEKDSDFMISHTTLNDRFCVELQDSHLINQQAKRLYTKLLQSFVKSKLNNIKIDNIHNTSLTIIDSPSKICFFKKASRHLQKLIANSKFSHDQKLAVLYELCSLLNTTVLSDVQYNIAINFVFSAINCLSLSKSLNDSAIWENTEKSSGYLNTFIYNTQVASQLTSNKNIEAQLKQYPLSIDLLCIEEEKRFKYRADNKITDFGAHAFDNEWLYMERCHRAFLYLLNTQIGSYHEINFDDLRDTNAITGSNVTKARDYGNVQYGCYILYDGYRFTQLLKQGVLSDEYLNYDIANISIEERLTKLQCLFRNIFCVDIPLTTIYINNQLYFTIKSDQDHNINLTDIDQQLLNDLHGKTDNKAFVFKITHFGEATSNYALILNIQYIYNKMRADVCQHLLDIYYKKIKEFPEDTRKKINLAVSLCIMLQRIHPFADANGRTIFFILLPVLLYQFNIWLTRMFKDPWLLIDLAAPEEITEQILPLCIPAPCFKNKISFYDNIKLEELTRIAASLGDLKLIKSILSIDPNIVYNKIEITPAKKKLSMLELAVLHNRVELVNFILANVPEHILSFKFLAPLVDTGLEYDSKQATEILCEYIKNRFNFIRGEQGSTNLVD